MPDRISSTKNEKIKEVRRLLDKPAHRRETGLFIAEGLREIVLAIRAGYRIDQLFICEEQLQPDPGYRLEEVQGRVNEKAVYYLSHEVYAFLAYRESTEGIIAVLRAREHPLDSLTLPEKPLLLVIESAEKPGNLGAMLRTADAAGVDAVIICDPRTDLYNPNVIRSGIGTVFTNQIAICDSEEAIRFLQHKNILILAAELNATEAYFQQDLKQPVAVVVGSEAHGLSDPWIQHAGARIKIPMKGTIDSLNVSVSAAVILYEAVRQRTA